MSLPSSDRLLDIGVQPLEQDTFAPYGTVLDADRPLVPQLTSGHWSVEQVELPDGFGGGVAASIARHFSYDQVLVGTSGRTYIVVARPTTPELATVVVDDIEVFALELGQTLLVRKGTWHTTVPAPGGSAFVNITRRDPNEVRGGPGDADRDYITAIRLDPRIHPVDTSDEPKEVEPMSLTDDELQAIIARFDVFAPEFQEDPFPLYNEIRERCPVAHSDSYGGHWIVSRYEDVEAVARDYTTFSSKKVLIPHFEHFYGEQIPLELDPPEHTKFRQALSPLFGPPRIARIEPRIRDTARRLVTAMRQKDSFEIVSEFADPLPAETFLHSFDIPAGRLPDLYRFKAQMYAGVKKDDPNYDARRAEILSFFGDMVDDRRAAGANGDDTISELIRATVDGRPWSDEEIINAGVVLMLASLDTTTSALGLIIGHLAERPDLRQRLVDEPEVIPTAVEEFMRYEHLLHNGRLITEDTEIHGVPMKQGDRIMMLFGAAHRDPRVYENPDEIDFDRVGLKHMAFGVGPHRCLGNHLARATLRIALEELHAQIPVYSVKPGTRPERHETYVRGMTTLHLVPR